MRLYKIIRMHYLLFEIIDKTAFRVHYECLLIEQKANNIVYNYIYVNQGSKLEAASQVPMALKVEKPGVIFMTIFKVKVVKTKFILAKYN